jgi:hypothetical protein
LPRACTLNPTRNPTLNPKPQTPNQVDGIAKGRHGRRPGLSAYVDGVPLTVESVGGMAVLTREVFGLGAPSAGGEGLKGGEYDEGGDALQAGQALAQKILGAREFVRQSHLTQHAHQIPRLLASNVQAAAPPPPPHSEQPPIPPLNVLPPSATERSSSKSWDRGVTQSTPTSSFAHLPQQQQQAPAPGAGAPSLRPAPSQKRWAHDHTFVDRGSSATDASAVGGGSAAGASAGGSGRGESDVTGM